MPIKRGSRLWDPARRVPSTHRASPVRTFVYEQLGLSKPGFWADWRKRTIEEPEPAGYQEEEEAPEINDPTKDYSLQEFQGDGPSKKKNFKNLEFGQENQQPSPSGGKVNTAWAPLLLAQSKAWFKSNPFMTSSNALDLIGLERAVSNREAAAFLMEKGPDGTGLRGLSELGKFYGEKAAQRAAARARQPFGSGMPTNFDKMLALLERPKPIYKPPTFEILTQGTSTIVAQLPDYTIGQLNVSQNGYVTNTASPQKQAGKAIAGRLQSAGWGNNAKAGALPAGGRLSSKPKQNL